MLLDGQAEDLYDVIPEETALHCERRWQEAMDDARTKKKPVSVWKLLYKSMGRKFMLGSLYKVFWLVAVVLQVTKLFRKNFFLTKLEAL